MRLKKKESNLKLGDTRIVEKFLYLPTTVDGETRWLETTKIKQSVTYEIDPLWGTKSELGWVNTQWFNPKKIL